MTPSPIRIEPFDDPRRFIDLGRRFYRDDPYYVPPLTCTDRRQVDPRKNPFFEHATVGLFVARRGAAPVGRASASRDALHDEFHGDRVGFFGHFEADDEQVAHALLAHVAQWLRERGATALRGPVDLSTNYRCGLWIEGEPGLPRMMMPHNPAHYREWFESYGLAKVKDLLAIQVLAKNLDMDRVERLVAKVQRRTPVSLRSIDPCHFEEEVRTLWDLYNRIWRTNWGFAPMTEAEFRSEASNLKAVLRPSLTVIGEQDGRAVAFSLGIPDLNVAIRACDGRLFPFGWWRFWRTFRKLHRFRMLTLGVVPELRKTGIDALLLHEAIRKGLADGFDECEASWILEDNVGMLQPLLRAGGTVYRRYRIFEKGL